VGRSSYHSSAAWEVYVVLSYFVSGQEYTKKKTTGIKRMRGRGSNAGKKDVIAQALEIYPINSEFPKPIYFNPNRPGQSVFEPGVQSRMFIYPAFTFALYLVAMIGFFNSLPGDGFITQSEISAILHNPLGITLITLIIMVPILVFLNFLQVYFGLKNAPSEESLSGQNSSEVQKNIQQLFEEDC
jgi:hypothetical protein